MRCSQLRVSNPFSPTNLPKSTPNAAKLQSFGNCYGSHQEADYEYSSGLSVVESVMLHWTGYRSVRVLIFGSILRQRRPNWNKVTLP